MTAALRLNEAIDLATFSCRLVWTSEGILPSCFPLWVRRRLHDAGRKSLDPSRFATLFEPSLPDDPVAVRRFQRPAPPFIFYPVTDTTLAVDEGDEHEVRFSLLGTGIALLGEFVTALTELGATGVLHNGQGRFAIESLVSLSDLGAVIPVETKATVQQMIQVNDARWRLEHDTGRHLWTLRFLSPARLITQGRPLFACTLADLLPFALRRVGSMLYTWCGQDVVVNAQDILAQLQRVTVHDSSLRWCDWSQREQAGTRIELGGVLGEVQFSGEMIDDLLAVLTLAAQLNIGRGAAYGAGSLSLECADEGLVVSR